MSRLPEKLVKLRDLVGPETLESLRKRNTVLQIWRRSTPHNWFVENSKHKILWHSCEEDRQRPNLRLFERVEDSETKIMVPAAAAWIIGADQGASELSTYRLKSEYCLKGSPWKEAP